MISTTPILTKKDDQGNTIGVEFIVHQEKVCKTETSTISLMIPQYEFFVLNLHTMDLITHKEIITRISPLDSLCYIMFGNLGKLPSVITKCHGQIEMSLLRVPTI